MCESEWGWAFVSSHSEAGGEWMTVWIIIVAGFGLASALLLLIIIWFRGQGAMDDLMRGLEERDELGSL
jgi:hypothetical protein